MFRKTCSFRIISVISQAYRSATDEDCRAVKVKAHEVWKIGTSFLFGENCVVKQILKAGTQSS